jgi:exonuclease VII small subunit
MEKRDGLEKKKLVLGEVVEREIELYAFENSMIASLNSSNRQLEEAQRNYEEAQRNYEEAQRNYEEAQRNYEAILMSRIWRSTRWYRQTSSRIKSHLKSSVLGTALLRGLRALVG